MTPKHTPEPWSYIKSRTLIHVETDLENPHGAGIHVCSVPHKNEANAERIVACVNALAGLNPEAVRDVVEALEFYADEVPSTAADQDAGKKARAALAKLKS